MPLAAISARLFREKGDRREYLSWLRSGWRDVLVPLPTSPEGRAEIASPVRDYFDGAVQTRKSFDKLMQIFGTGDMATRP